MRKLHETNQVWQLSYGRSFGNSSLPNLTNACLAVYEAFSSSKKTSGRAAQRVFWYERDYCSRMLKLPETESCARN